MSKQIETGEVKSIEPGGRKGKVKLPGRQNTCTAAFTRPVAKGDLVPVAKIHHDPQQRIGIALKDKSRPIGFRSFGGVDIWYTLGANYLRNNFPPDAATPALGTAPKTIWDFHDPDWVPYWEISHLFAKNGILYGFICDDYSDPDYETYAFKVQVAENATATKSASKFYANYWDTFAILSTLTNHMYIAYCDGVIGSGDWRLRKVSIDDLSTVYDVKILNYKEEYAYLYGRAIIEIGDYIYSVYEVTYPEAAYFRLKVNKESGSVIDNKNFDLTGLPIESHEYDDNNLGYASGLDNAVIQDGSRNILILGGLTPGEGG